MRFSYRISALLVAALPIFPGTGLAQQGRTKAEQALFDSANRARVARRLPQLRWDAALAASARNHALRMAQRNSLSHQLPGESDIAARATQAGARFSALAENVAEGPSPAAIFAQWMNSAPHRANLLDPDLDSIGIGVSDRRGQLFAVEDFSRAIAALTIEQQERQVGVLLKERGLSLVDQTHNARRACARGREYAGNGGPLAFIRFEAADLENLPGVLVKKIQGGRYHAAAVGACRAGRPEGFATYRVAVLLF